jgi:hypothetical protein
MLYTGHSDVSWNETNIFSTTHNKPPPKMHLSTRFQQWIKSQKLDKNSFGHECIMSDFTDMYNDTSPKCSTAHSMSLDLCGCSLCLDYAKRALLEANLEVIGKTLACRVTAICTQCGQPAKSNRAKLCHDKRCYNAKRQQERPREKKPITKVCVVCGKQAKDNKAKLCKEQTCYNTHKRNQRKKNRA